MSQNTTGHGLTAGGDRNSASVVGAITGGSWGLSGAAKEYQGVAGGDCRALPLLIM